MSFIKSRKTTPSTIATTTNSISISNCGGSRDAMVEDEKTIDEEEVLIAHQREMLADDEDEEEEDGGGICNADEDEDFHPSCHTPPKLGSNYSQEDPILDNNEQQVINNDESHIGPVEEDISIKDFQVFEDISDMFNRPLPPSILAKIEPLAAQNGSATSSSLPIATGGRSIFDGEDDFIDKATPTSSEASQEKVKLWGEPPIPFIRLPRKPTSQATASVSANNEKEEYAAGGGAGICSEDEDFRPSCHTPTFGRSNSRDDDNLMMFDEQQQMLNKNNNEQLLDNGIGHPPEEEEDISGTMGFEDPDLKEIAELYNRAVSPCDLATISLSPPLPQPGANSSKEGESAEDNKQDESEKKEEYEATSEDKEEEEKQPAKAENILLGFQMFKNFDELLTCPANISPLPPPEPIAEEEDGSSSEEGEEPQEDDKQVEDEEKTEEEKKKREEEVTPEKEKEVEEDISKDFYQDVQVQDIADWLSGVLPPKVLAKIGPPASQQQSSSLPADRPRVIYTREQIRAVGQSRSADEWTTYMWTNYGDTWPIHNPPFELDPALRCPYALQLRIERERERDGRMHYATKFGVQRPQQETVMAVVGNQQRRSSQPRTPTNSKVGGKQPQQNEEDDKPKKAKKNKKKSSNKNEDKEEEANEDDSKTKSNKKKKDTKTKTIDIGTNKPGPAMAKVPLMMSTSAQAPAKKCEEEKPSISFSKKSNSEKKIKDRNMANILAEQKEEAKKRKQKDAEEMDWTNSELEDDDEDEEEEREEQKQRKKKQKEVEQEENKMKNGDEKKEELDQEKKIKKSKMATMVEKAVRNMVDVVMVAVPDEEDGGKRELISLDSLVECQAQIANQWKQNPMAQQIWNGYLAQIVTGIEQLKLSSSNSGSATTNE